MGGLIEDGKRTRRGHLALEQGHLTSEEFVRDLHRALRDLYDAAGLSQSSLLALLGLGEPGDPASYLRGILVDAIESLKPGADVPPQARDWRTYRILFHRFVEQFTQRQVAASLALSVRQLRREEARATQVLADHLRARYASSKASLHEGGRPGYRSGPTSKGSETLSREKELAWVRNSFPRGVADVGKLLQSILATVDPLVQSCDVEVHCALPEGLPRLAVQPDSVSQALLNVLTAGIRSVPGGSVHLTAQVDASEMSIYILPKGKDGVCAAPREDVLESLAMARKLVGLSGGALEMLAKEEAQGPFPAQFVLPVAEVESVLVIDDNVDTLQLFRRYLADTRYSFIGGRDAEQALALATTVAPSCIVLDIMLPGVDGWQVLGRLREHPKTRGVPIIVCSILPQEQLALALGAAAFLHKPVSRDGFLSAIDRQTGHSLKASQ